MARIKVTGYLYTENLDPADLDLTHEMGLSSDGFVRLSRAFGGLEDVEFVLVGDEDDDD